MAKTDSPRTSPRILILSASAGAGHVRAADALLQSFLRHPLMQNGGVAEHWDTLSYTTRALRELYSRVYLKLVNQAPNVLGYMYEKTDTPWKNSTTRTIEKFNARPFIKAVLNFQPDIVVCTHFTPASIVSDLYEKKKLPVSPAIVVTDLDCHAMWLVKNYQHYFVALGETAAYMGRLGIDESRIHVTGIPVDPVFSEAKGKPSARRALDLDPDLFTVLVSAGGFGVGPVEGLIRELLRLKHRAQIVAIAGRSESLKNKLIALAGTLPKSSHRLVPIGFTKQMDEYMAAADILISKPGGLTTSEAMARGLPMCVANPIPGQEERNSDHLLELGAAIRCNNLLALAYKLDTLLDTPGKLAAMRAAAQSFGHPDAGQVIAETCMRQWQNARP